MRSTRTTAKPGAENPSASRRLSATRLRAGKRRKTKPRPIMVVLSILLGFLACAVTSLALGITAVRALRLDLRRAEALCLGYTLGSALASTLTAESPRGIAPRGAHRSGREPLDSSGSCHQLKAT